MSTSKLTLPCRPSRLPLKDFSGISASDIQVIIICSMPIDMLMASHGSLTWTLSSTFSLRVSTPSKPKMLLAATPRGQLNSPIKAYQLISPFLGTRLKNTFNWFPIGIKVKKKFGNKMIKGKVVRNPEDTTEWDPNADDFGETTQSWQVEYEDQEQENCNEREMEQIAYGTLPRFDPHNHRDDDYICLNGETSWILVTDHFSRMKHGDTWVSKASPINWLRDFLVKHAPVCSGKYVFMDQGGELYNNPEVRKLFTWFGYEIRPTSDDVSNQNAPVERGHLVVANAIRALLLGTNLPIKFWSYVFHFWLCIDNYMASRDQLVVDT